MRFTVFGSRGFIGSNLVKFLHQKGYEVFTPKRGEILSVLDFDLGHAIYAIGLTADFRQRPHDTVDAHVCLLSKVLQKISCKSFLYLSSTRVYGSLSTEQQYDEVMPISVNPSLASLYDLSKLLGESICIARACDNFRVARLSNVYGPGMTKHSFLGSITSEAQTIGRVEIREAPESAKDYIYIDDVVQALVNVSTLGKKKCYNIASGVQITHADIARVIKSTLGADVTFGKNGLIRIMSPVLVDRYQKEFGLFDKKPLKRFEDFVNSLRER